MYRTAIEQAAWADKLGFTQVFLAEHHGAPDGYCPSPMVMAASIFGVTERINVHLSALVVTMHDPLRMAEDLAVLDNISNGRIWLTAGMGYRPHEFEMFGKDMTKKLGLMNKALDTLKQAWSGEPFEYEGRTVRVTPKGIQPGGPNTYMGGSTDKSALRAARRGYQYFPGHPGLWDIYAAEREACGFPPPEPLVKSIASFLYVTDDPDRDWPRVAPHVAYATNTYAEWATERGGGDTLYKAADTVEALKAMPNIKVLTPRPVLRLAQDPAGQRRDQLPRAARRARSRTVVGEPAAVRARGAAPAGRGRHGRAQPVSWAGAALLHIPAPRSRWSPRSAGR